MMSMKLLLVVTPPSIYQFATWPITPDPAGISRRSRRSAPRWIRSMIPIAAADISETLNPNLRVTVSEIFKRPAEIKEIYKLYQIVNNNIKNKIIVITS